jgi:hypothetical protein
VGGAGHGGAQSRTGTAATADHTARTTSRGGGGGAEKDGGGLGATTATTAAGAGDSADKEVLSKEEEDYLKLEAIFITELGLSKDQLPAFARPQEPAT